MNAQNSAENGLLAAYVAAYGAPKMHSRETGEWSGVQVCAEDGEPWPCRLARTLSECPCGCGESGGPGCPCARCQS